MLAEAAFEKVEVQVGNDIETKPPPDAEEGSEPPCQNQVAAQASIGKRNAGLRTLSRRPGRGGLDGVGTGHRRGRIRSGNRPDGGGVANQSRLERQLLEIRPGEFAAKHRRDLYQRLELRPIPEG